MKAVSDGGQITRRRRRVAEKSPEPYQDVLVALRRIIRATDLHSKQLSKAFGLTTPQAYILQAVHELGEVTTGEVSRHVNLSQGTVTTILDRLERRGLIERYRSLADRRVVHTRLTTQGRRVLRRAPPLLQERFMAAFAQLRPTDRTRIVQSLRDVADMMGAGDLDAAPLLAVGASVAAAEDDDAGTRKFKGAYSGRARRSVPDGQSRHARRRRSRTTV